MSAFYNWDKVETMVGEQMKDAQRETEQINLRQKAGIASSGERIKVAFGNALVKLGERLQRKNARSHQSYRTTDGKYAV